MTEATWKKPGPGTWELDSSHFTAPGPIIRGLMEHSFERGFTQVMDMFGSPLRTMSMAWVNGRFYRRMVPLVGGGIDLPAPPAPVLKLVTRLHPVFRRRERKAKQTFESKAWMSELALWESEWKPALITRNQQLTDVDVAALDDAALAEHLDAAHDHVRDGMTLHFRLHGSDMGPLGHLMVHLEDWGLRRDDTFGALVAASPATREPRVQLRAIADALRDGGVDAATVASLEEVRAIEPAGKLLDEYLRFHGWRLTGYDLEDRALIEMPDVVVRSIRAAATYSPNGEVDALAAVEELRNRLPAEHRAEFDDLVKSARLSYGLRDENGPLTYEWPAGLLRRAVLEAGARLHASGRLAARSDVFELDVPEIVSLLTSGRGPSIDDVAARAEERRVWRTLRAPERLGREEPPPPVDAMPPYLARVTRMILTVVGTLEAAKADGALRGLGIGNARYTGVARVVCDAGDALETMEPGDVLVAPYTAPTYNAVLAMAGAVVTEEGGLLCHAAVIARELGLPAVIGAPGATTLIPDGATVEVDPSGGVVRVLSPT